MNAYDEVIEYLEDRSQYWKSKIVKNLVADSELLDGLIEMAAISVYESTNPEKVEYVFYYDGDEYYGPTPREAIEAAVRKWKEQK